MPKTGSYDVTDASGTPFGSLEVSRQGLFTVFSFRSEEAAAVSRLYCLSGGRYVSVGIPVRAASGCTLTRRFSRLQLEQMELCEIDGVLLIPCGETPPEAESPRAEAADVPTSAVEAVHDLPEKTEDAEPGTSPSAVEDTDDAPEARSSPVPGWFYEPDPASYFDLPELRSACENASGVLVSHQQGDDFLAFPFDGCGEFPLVSAFRFARPASIGGKDYIIFRVRDGEPV